MSKKLTWFELNKPWYPREEGKKYVNLKPVQKVNKAGAFIIKNPKGLTWKRFYDEAINFEIESDKEYRAGNIEKAYKLISEALRLATMSASLKHAQILREKENRSRGADLEAYMQLVDDDAIGLIDKISDEKHRLASQIYGTKHEKALKHPEAETATNPADHHDTRLAVKKILEERTGVRVDLGIISEYSNQAISQGINLPEEIADWIQKQVFKDDLTSNPKNPLSADDKRIKKEIETKYGEKVDYKVVKNEPGCSYFDVLKKGVSNV